MVGYNLASVSPLLPPLPSPFSTSLYCIFPVGSVVNSCKLTLSTWLERRLGLWSLQRVTWRQKEPFCQHLHVGYHKRIPAGPTWSLCLESTPEKGKWDTRIARLSQKPVWCLRTGFPEVTIQPDSRGMEGNVLGGKRSVRTHRIRNWRARGQQRYCRSSRERTDHRSPLTLPQER